MLQANEIRECETIHDVKKLIEKKSNYSVASQILCFENVLVPENHKMEDLMFKQSGRSTQETNQMRLQKKPFSLTLKITKGQCHLKVSVISGKSQPIPLSIIVHGSASVHQLKELIFRRLPLELRNL